MSSVGNSWGHKNSQNLSSEENYFDALVIGQVTLDTYYEDGDFLATLPGGTALNAGLWFDKEGGDTELMATLGEDFPFLDSLDFSDAEMTDVGCPVTEIRLKNKGKENVEHNKGDYELNELEGTGTYDLLYLTSGRDEYLDPFLHSEAHLKGFSPGPEPEKISLDSLESCLEEADYVLMNDREEEILEEGLGKDFSSVPGKYDIESVLVTSSEKVKSYASSESKEFFVKRIDNPVDTVGAGDTFSSNYLVNKLNGKEHERAVYEAIEKSRDVVRRKGAIPTNPIR